jgi:hypothetical protein
LTGAQSDSVALIALRTLRIHYPHGAGDQRPTPDGETNMNKIVELKIEETKSVVGGVKTDLPVATSIPRERLVSATFAG